MKKIVLAGTIPAEARAMLREQLGNRFELVDAYSAEEAAAVSEASYVVSRGIKWPAEMLEKLPDSVELLHRWGVGYDSIDIEAAGKQGIRVAICTGGNAQPVAELTMALILTFYRKLPELFARAKEGRKDKEDIIAESYLLQDKMIGLLGLGNIGGKVARMAQGFGAKVQYYDVFRAKPEVERELGVQFVSFEELLSTSDIVSVHVPLLDSTTHMINREAFARMKPNALIVNTARGPIVDTRAMLEAIDSGKLMGAALDTIEGEPLPADHPVHANKRVLLTPHGGGNTCDNLSNMVRIIAQNITDMDDGKLPAAKYLVNEAFLVKA